MTLNDWTQCDFCLFPARYNYFKSYIEKGNVCPMCSQNMKVSEIKLIAENKVKEILQGKLESIDHSEGAADESAPARIKRSSIRIPDDANLNMSLDASDDSNIAYKHGESMLPPGLIGGSGGMAV